MSNKYNINIIKKENLFHNNKIDKNNNNIKQKKEHLFY